MEDRLEGDDHVPIRDIEINDLLGREPVQLDTENIGQLLEGRRVMVTGAGGSIGSEICRQIIAFHPESLILVGRGENRIFAIERELRGLRTATVALSLHRRRDQSRADGADLPARIVRKSSSMPPPINTCR